MAQSLWGLPDGLLHCGISVTSAARFMAEMGHECRFSSLVQAAACPRCLREQR
jgi:hypothetical protein